MGSSIHSTDERKILPQLEKHKDFVKSRISKPVELPKDKSLQNPIIEFKDENLYPLLEKWKEKKSDSLAADIISNAMVNGELKEVKQIIKYILDKYPDDNILKSIIRIESKEKTVKEEVDYNKRKLSLEPNDAFTWTDQAINFLEIGDRDEVLNCIESAVRINNNSTFVIRNASRLFNILGDNGRAIQLLKNSEYYKYDPNILSAEIAFSQLEKRRTQGTLFGEKLMRDGNFTDLQFSELAGALGTNEYLKGDLKRSEALFDRSLIDPNLNSFAQSLWYKQNPIDSKTIKRFSTSNEVQTQRYFKEGNFKKAGKYSKIWIHDEPFSARPYNSAAYISGTLFENYDEASDLIVQLRARQESLKGGLDEYLDVSLRNDIAFYHLKNNNINEANRELEPLREIEKLSTGKSKVQFVVIATLGLLAYKTGDRETGRKLYRRTINEFAKYKDKHNLHSAFINYFLEEVDHSNSKDELLKLKKELEAIIGSNADQDIIFRKTEALKKFDKKIKAL